MLKTEKGIGQFTHLCLTFYTHRNVARKKGTRNFRTKWLTTKTRTYVVKQRFPIQNMGLFRPQKRCSTEKVKEFRTWVPISFADHKRKCSEREMGECLTF